MHDILIEYLLQANELLQFGEEEPDTVEQVIPHFSNLVTLLALIIRFSKHHLGII